MKLSRLYDNAADAKSAADALLAAGFRQGDFEILTADEKGWISPETLIAKEVAKRNAATYAAALRAGKYLLLVNPLLGFAEPATAVLAAPRGGENTKAEVGFEGTGWDEAAPISSALFLPVLAKNPTPFASFWNVPTLLKKYWFFSNWFGAKLLTDQKPFSKLSSNPAPLSSLLKLKTIKK